MTPDPFARRISYAFLCISIFLVVIATFRALRIPGVHQALAIVLVTAISVAAWILGAHAIRSHAEERQGLALTGGLLVSPWVVLSLCFPGIGTPWQATDAENQMRYLAILIAGMLLMGGFVILKEMLGAAGERFYSALGFAATMLASPLYLLFAAIQFESYAANKLVNSGQVPPEIILLDRMSTNLLFFGTALTYLATASFAVSMGRTRWLGRRASHVFVIASFTALLCLVIRGLRFPNPTAAFEHWYTIPGFVVGIPAIPWIMPYLLGVVLLRRAGD